MQFSIIVAMFRAAGNHQTIYNVSSFTVTVWFPFPVEQPIAAFKYLLNAMTPLQSSQLCCLGHDLSAFHYLCSSRESFPTWQGNEYICCPIKQRILRHPCVLRPFYSLHCCVQHKGSARVLFSK